MKVRLKIRITTWLPSEGSDVFMLGINVFEHVVPATRFENKSFAGISYTYQLDEKYVMLERSSVQILEEIEVNEN